MQIDIHHYIHFDTGQLSRIEATLATLTKGNKMANEALARLTQEVADTKTAADSAVTLIQGLAQQIRDLSDDPAALNALADTLDATQAEIAAAVTANTQPPGTGGEDPNPGT